MEYTDLFSAVHPDQALYPYQRILAEDIFFPSLLDIPTGCGKNNPDLEANRKK